MANLLYTLKLIDARLLGVLESMAEGMEEVQAEEGETARSRALARVGEMLRASNAGQSGPLVVAFHIDEEHAEALYDVVENCLDNSSGDQFDREEEDPDYESEIYAGDVVLTCENGPDPCELLDRAYMASRRRDDVSAEDREAIHKAYSAMRALYVKCGFLKND